MSEKTEWMLFGWTGGLGCIVWGLINLSKYGWFVDENFNYSPLILIFVGVTIIVFTMVVSKYGDW